MIIHTHRSFEKKYLKLQAKLQDKFRERRDLFIDYQFHPLLDNHALHGEWQGYRSINVTGDFRAVFKQENNIVTFVDIDTHHKLYGT
ncbi:MAG: type II toxin-antitoxin system mRNA interferase toxin, RelE/StbE family [bacterium]|nr:type II toxin-antitoxin system mRNA interferase toxin, RelE/StbE family [bacterium]